MLNNIRTQLPTALIVALIVAPCQWGVGWLFQRWYRSLRTTARFLRFVVQTLRITTQFLVTAGIVLVTLVLILRTPRYVWLAQHASPIAKALVSAPYQTIHGSLPCEPKVTQPYLDKVGNLSKYVRDQEYMAALRWDFSEGLLEEVDITPTADGGAKRDFRLLPLGEKFIEELCRTGAL